MTKRVKIRTIEWSKRLTVSAAGNPRHEVHFTNGDVAITQSDAACNHGLDGAEFQGVPLRVTFSRAGRITHAAKAGKFYRVHVHDYRDGGKWLAQADFPARPVSDEIAAELPVLAAPGRYEVRVTVIQGGEEYALYSWLQGEPAASVPTLATTRSQHVCSTGCGCRAWECGVCGTRQLVDRQARYEAETPGPDQYAAELCAACGVPLCDGCALADLHRCEPAI